jgi:NADH-quinone oxidoreductase subunit N
MLEFLIYMKSELMVTLIIFVLLIIKLGKGLSNEKILGLTQILLLINVIIAVGWNNEGRLFGDMFITSKLIGVQKTILSLGVYLISLSFPGWCRKSEHLTEFMVLLLSSLLGMYFLISSGNILILFLSIELSTLPLAALANFDLEKKKSAEAAMKMILNSAFSTAMFLFGASFLYGATGTVSFSALAVSTEINGLQLMAFVFLFSAFAFKLSVVPFHLWTADVYEGSPIAVTAFLSIISKAAFAFVLVTILYKVLLPLESAWYWMIVALSVATMLIGNLFALRQKNIRRFLAFSSIAQVGFILAGISGSGWNGESSVTYFVLVYLFSNLAAFGVAGVLNDQAGIEDIEGLKGLRQTNPFLAWMMALALFSLAGIPPTAGFFGKIFLLGSGASRGHIWFILIAALNMVISLYYYLKIIRVMFMEKPLVESAVVHTDRQVKFSLIICAAGILFTGVFSWVYDYIFLVSRQ